jgi:hypothetical protein
MDFPKRVPWIDGAALVAFFAAAIAMQCVSGAFRSEFGAHPDEPAHVVTSLLVRDYLVSGFSQPPMRYAESYYAHYPKAALGHWPPVYYALQAAWNVVFPAGRASILVCHALITALLAAVLFRWTRQRYSPLIALAAGFWLLSQPLIQWLNSVVMLDIAVALFALSAALAFAGYLHTPGWRAAAWFGFWAALAILTKGTGFALALLPATCLLLARRWNLALRGSFWLPAILVAAVCGPWYFLAPEALQQQSGAFGVPSATPRDLWSMFFHWIGRFDVPMFVLAAIGIVANRRAFRLESRNDERWVAGVAFLCSTLVFLHVVQSANEHRNLAPLMPPLVLFATAGIIRLVELLPLGRISPNWRTALVVAVLIAWTGANALNVPRKPPVGYALAAADLAPRPKYHDSVFLVSGDPTDEGMFISEMALAERRPTHVVLRASKLLSRSAWSGMGYSTPFATSEQINAYLRKIPVGILVLQQKPERPRPHHDLLSRMVASHPDSWRLLGTYPAAVAGTGADPRFLVYELAGHQAMPRGEFRIRLEDKLGKDVAP